MRQIFLILLLEVMGFTKANAQIRSISYTVDSSTYKKLSEQYFYPGPLSHSTRSLYAFDKKNSDQCDIFSFKGKIASVTIPLSIKDSSINQLSFSQTFVDNDADWECLLYMSSGTIYVLDNDGTVLLEGFGTRPNYGYDGNNTYVVDYFSNSSGFTLKAWQLRTGITSSSPQEGLYKKNGTSPQMPMITYGPSGSYRVSLQPAGGGKTAVQVFDLMGRLTFSKVFEDINKKTTFTIPAENVPQSPFVTQTTDNNGQTSRTTVPIH